jgi:hypothetical protein
MAIRDAKGVMAHGASRRLLSWKRRLQRRQHRYEEGELQCETRQKLASLFSFILLRDSPVIALKCAKRHSQRFLACHDYELS